MSEATTQVKAPDFEQIAVNLAKLSKTNFLLEHSRWPFLQPDK